METKTKPESAPAAHWRLTGEPDPHAGHYDCERADLTLGKLTDDELANAAYMNYDRLPHPQDILNGMAHMPIVYMTAVKARIRWLSRKLEEGDLSELLEDEGTITKACPRTCKTAARVN